MHLSLSLSDYLFSLFTVGLLDGPGLLVAVTPLGCFCGLVTGGTGDGDSGAGEGLTAGQEK